MIVQIGKRSFEWHKRGKRWIGPCVITRGCKGEMSVGRGNLVARCPVCGGSRLVELDRQPGRKSVGV